LNTSTLHEVWKCSGSKVLEKIDFSLMTSEFHEIMKSSLTGVEYNIIEVDGYFAEVV